MTNTPSLPPAGFYLDPSDNTLARWWDGSGWTDITRPATELTSPDTTTGGEKPTDFVQQILGPNGVLERLPQEAQDYYNRNTDTVHQAAGGALIADGVVGFGRNRVGIFGALKNMIISAVMVTFAVVFLILSNEAGAGGNQNGTPATATVQSVTIDTGSDNTTVCSPIVSFTTADGQDITAQYSIYSSSMCGIASGDTYEITYDANNPTRISGIDSTGDILFRLFPLLFVIILGIVFISSLFTVILRATQIGGGIAIIAKARAKDRAKQEAKASRKRGSS